MIHARMMVSLAGLQAGEFKEIPALDAKSIKSPTAWRWAGLAGVGMLRIEVSLARRRQTVSLQQSLTQTKNRFKTPRNLKNWFG
jgi:hypothetical protein